MCFSAAASFAVAGVAGITGLATLRLIRRREEAMLAAFPMIFASQQAVEGALWLQLNGPASCLLTNVFIVYAEVLWPIIAPLGLMLVEPGKTRRRVMQGLLGGGIFLAIYLGAKIVASPYEVSAATAQLRYENGLHYPWAIYPVYLAVTCGPFLLSSHVPLRQLGILLVIGFGMSAYFYRYVFISVWCFFAAGASVLVFRYFALSASVETSIGSGDLTPRGR